MVNTPQITWNLANPYGILINEAENAWWSGHVTDVLELDGGDAGLLVATETGGVWTVSTNGMTVALSNTWDMPDVNCLAAGPDGPRHFFAGCDNGVIYESDASAAVPLLNWKPVSQPLPAAAGDVNGLAILHRHRRIVAACDGGLYWSMIPATPKKRGCLGKVLPPQPRPQYAWYRADVEDKGQGGYYSVTVGSISGRTERPGEEDLDRVSIVAGGNNAGVFVGRWTGAGTLVLRRGRLIDDQGRDLTDWWFLSTGATSVAVCERFPRRLYAACAYPDGRFKMVLRSRDGGRRWEITGFDVTGVPGQTDVRAVAGELGHVWNNCIGVMPSGPGVVAFGWQVGVFLSPNEGKTWIYIGGGSHLHPDVHTVRFKETTADEKHYLYVGSDGGLAQVDLDDALAGTLTARSDYNRLLPTHQCYSTWVTRQFYGTLSVSPEHQGWVSTGVQDNGNIYSDLGAVSPWRQVDGGDGGWNGFVADGGLVRNIMGAFARSARRQGNQLADNGVPPITVPSPGDPNGLLAPIGDVVRRPRYRNAARQLMVAVGGFGANIYGLFADGNQQGTYHWERLGALPQGLTVAGLGSHTGATVFVGSADGRIFALDSAQGTFLELPVILPKPMPNQPQSGGTPNRIVTLSENVAFATLNSTNLGNSYVLRLDGLKWTPPLMAGLPMQSFYGIEGVFRAERQVVFVATDDRVYMSEDGGQQWVPASAGLPRRPHGADLRIGMEHNQAWLFLSTFGRSVWRAQLHRVYWD